MLSQQALDALIAQASDLRQAERYAEAAARYQEILSLAPGFATGWYNLGLCLRWSGRFEEALQAYEKAIESGIDQPEEAYLNRSTILMDHLRRHDEAERDLQLALTCNPNYAPALLNLANLAEDRGNREAAAERYVQLLAVAPNCWEGMARYARLRAQRGDTSSESELRQALARNDLNASDRASLGFALGDVLDRAGEYDAAFVAYASANATARNSTSALYDETAEADLIQKIIEAFPGEDGARPRGSWSPIIICGMFRSGSTLVEQVLAGHPRVTACGELWLIPRLVNGVLAPFPERLQGLPDAAYRELAEGYEGAVKQLFPGVDLATDKRPDNFLYLGLIKRLFPAAKIVHTQRNPLDNALSIFCLHLDQSMRYSTDLANIARHYRLYRQLMAHWERLFSDDIIHFDYDEFIRNPENEARRLTNFLGLDWRDECLAFHDRANLVKTASVWQVREPLYSRSSGRWRNYESHLRDVARDLAEFL